MNPSSLYEMRHSIVQAVSDYVDIEAEELVEVSISLSALWCIAPLCFCMFESLQPRGCSACIGTSDRCTIDGQIAMLAKPVSLLQTCGPAASRMLSLRLQNSNRDAQ